MPDLTEKLELTSDSWIVAIIGGGSTGTYAAVRLREDFNKTVLVIEQSSVLGGRVNTYSKYMNVSSHLNLPGVNISAKAG